MKINKSICRCQKCGKEADVDTSHILTSYPPKYDYTCPHCGYHGYTFCSECSIIEVEEGHHKHKNNKPAPKSDKCLSITGTAGTKSISCSDVKLKVMIGDNVITDKEDWNRVVNKFNEYEKKAKAFDLLADHIELLNFLTKGSCSLTHMTKSEIETVAAALGTTINWVYPEKKEEPKEEPKKKKHWWSR